MAPTSIITGSARAAWLALASRGFRKPRRRERGDRDRLQDTETIRPPEVALFQYGRRTRAMVDAVLDATCDGVLVSDFYAAERSLRHLVTCRKISGSTCSDQGTQTKLTLSSFFGTLALQRLDPLDQSRRLLASPQL